VEEEDGPMDDRGYTWFGEVLHRILKERNSSQSAFAREAQALGYDYRQNSISNWMRGVHAAPRDLPTLLDHLYDLGDRERMELALAFAYGQSLPKVDLEDVRAFRQHYKRMLEDEVQGTEAGALRLCPDLQLRTE
jgi:transcriptional regulator with XRE-family HTH domain